MDAATGVPGRRRTRRSSSCSRRPSDRHDEGARLHQELSAGRAREWRPVHPCRDLVRHRAGRDGQRRRGLALLLACSIRSTMRSTRRRPSATASSPMSWRPTSIRRRDKGGRGGWTWYTGSAGWLYRAAVEGILGIREGGQPSIVKPVLPSHWDGYSGDTATFRAQSTGSKCGAKRGDAAAAIEVDGKRQTGSEIRACQAGEVDSRQYIDTCRDKLAKSIAELAAAAMILPQGCHFSLFLKPLADHGTITLSSFLFGQLGTGHDGSIVMRRDCKYVRLPWCSAQYFHDEVIACHCSKSTGERSGISLPTGGASLSSARRTSCWPWSRSPSRSCSARIIDAISDKSDLSADAGAVGRARRLQHRRLRAGGARRRPHGPCAPRRRALRILRARHHHAALLASPARHLQRAAHAAARRRDAVRPVARIHAPASVDGRRAGAAGADRAVARLAHVGGAAGARRRSMSPSAGW